MSYSILSEKSNMTLPDYYLSPAPSPSGSTVSSSYPSSEPSSDGSSNNKSLRSRRPKQGEFLSSTRLLVSPTGKSSNKLLLKFDPLEISEPDFSAIECDGGPELQPPRKAKKTFTEEANFRLSASTPNLNFNPYSRAGAGETEAQSSNKLVPVKLVRRPRRSSRTASTVFTESDTKLNWCKSLPHSKESRNKEHTDSPPVGSPKRTRKSSPSQYQHLHSSVPTLSLDSPTIRVTESKYLSQSMHGSSTRKSYSKKRTSLRSLAPLIAFDSDTNNVATKAMNHSFHRSPRSRRSSCRSLHVRSEHQVTSRENVRPAHGSPRRDRPAMLQSSDYVSLSAHGSPRRSRKTTKISIADKQFANLHASEPNLNVDLSELYTIERMHADVKGKKEAAPSAKVRATCIDAPDSPTASGVLRKRQAYITPPTSDTPRKSKGHRSRSCSLSGARERSMHRRTPYNHGKRESRGRSLDSRQRGRSSKPDSVSPKCTSSEHTAPFVAEENREMRRGRSTSRRGRRSGSLSRSRHRSTSRSSRTRRSASTGNARTTGSDAPISPLTNLLQTSSHGRSQKHSLKSLAELIHRNPTRYESQHLSGQTRSQHKRGSYRYTNFSPDMGGVNLTPSIVMSTNENRRHILDTGITPEQLKRLDQLGFTITERK